MAKEHGSAKKREAQFDAAVEAALLDPATIIPVPDELQAEMREEGLEPVAQVRFVKITPKRQGQITDAVMRKYHKDLQDPDLLSDDRIMELAVAKGAWNPAQDARVAELQAATTGQMASLYNEGASRSQDWADEVEEKAERFLEIVRGAPDEDLSPDERDEAVERFRRWVLYAPDKQADYTARYPEVGDPYNPDRDLTWLLDRAVTHECTSLLEEIEDLRDKLEQYFKLRADKFELDLLIRKRTEIFSNSVESRQRNAGQMARLYFTSESVVDQKPAGPLAASLDGLYELPPAVIQWFVTEQFFFHNNIPRSAREYLDDFGFQAAERQEQETESAPMPTSDGSTLPSGESPVPPTPSNDSPRVEETDADSSASAVATI